MAQCKPQERILASASALATGRAYRLAGKVEQAQTFERRGEKILSLMQMEAPRDSSDCYEDLSDRLLTDWETAAWAKTPFDLPEWANALRKCLNMELENLPFTSPDGYLNCNF